MELLNQREASLEGLPRLDLPLNVTFCDYDRTRPLFDGSVNIPGIAPTYTLNIGREFCVRPVYEEYDVAEMSFSWYIMARDRGEPVRALPIFPLRMPPLSHIYVRSDAPYRTPLDLKGCRVASEAYRLTVNLWLRGICSDIYGLQPQDVEWFSSFEDEGAGYVTPDSVRLRLNAGDPEELLLAGDVDALFMPNAPDAFTNGDPRIRRLFADHESEGEAFYRTMNGIPMTHVLVASEALLEREPWIVDSFLGAFRAAQALVDAAYRRPKFLSIPGALGALERQRRFLGTTTMYTHGLDGNRHAVETFARYGYEQGYTRGLLSADELFATV
jgi:4,5-dihydroxyphthalate decarboxylase